MNWKKYIGILAAAIIIILLVIKLKSNKEKTQEKVYQYDKEKPVSVEADTIQLQAVDDAGSFTGTFEPNKESKISAEIQGKINAVLVDVGSTITKGQILYQLDNSLLKLQLQSVEVQIQGLQDDVKRHSILTKADAIQGIQLEKAELGLKTARLQKKTLLEQISKTTNRAPFDGIVTAKFNDEGGFAAPGVPLLQITDISVLKFTINVSEDDLSRFGQGKSYDITADAYPGILLRGKTVMIGSKSNIGNSFPVQFQVTNTKTLDIKSGMFGKVLLTANGPENGILIPSYAITGSAEQPQVYLIKNGKAILKDIVVAKSIGDRSVISSGLVPGDIIITKGFINLTQNANVIAK